MRNFTKYTLLLFAASLFLAGCSSDDNEGIKETNDVTVQAVDTRMQNHIESRALRNPTDFSFSQRYALGQVLNLSINGVNTRYRMLNNQWRPFADAALFLNGTGADVRIDIKPDEPAFQDGSENSLALADELEFVQTNAEPAWIFTANVVHSKSLIVLHFDLDPEDEVFIGNQGERMYRSPGTNLFYYVAPVGTQNLPVTFTANIGQEYTVNVSFSEGTRPNTIYNVPFSSGANIDIVVGDITITPWTDSESSGQGDEILEPALTETTTFNIPGLANLTKVKVIYGNGVIKEVNFDANGIATMPSAAEGRYIRAIKPDGAEEILVGARESTTISLNVGPDLKLVLRRNAQDQLLVGNWGEFMAAIQASKTGNNQTFVQDADLYLDSYFYTPETFGSAANVNNTYDGAGHNVHINMECPNPGMFGLLYGKVKKVIVASGSTINATSGHAGGITSRFAAGRIDSCANHANIISTNATAAGGIAGTLNTASSERRIEACYNTGTITGGNNLGGILGSVEFGSWQYAYIYFCYNSGVVSGSENVGGIIGYFDPAAYAVYTYIHDCYNSGTISGTASVGAIVGACSNSPWSSIDRSYFTGAATALGSGVLATTATEFSATAWPNANTPGWGANGGIDTKWGDLGAFGVSYPKLGWE